MSNWRQTGGPQPWSLDDAEETSGNGRPMSRIDPGNPYTRPGGSSGGREGRDPLDGIQNTHLYRDRGRGPRRETPPGRDMDLVWDTDRRPQRDLVREEDPSSISSAAFIRGLDVGGPHRGSADGGALQPSEGDVELERKKKELMLIQQEIQRRKTLIAVKAQGVVPLEERVNSILNKRRRWQEYPSTVSTKPVACQETFEPKSLRSLLEKRNSSILSSDREGGFCPEYREEPSVKGRVKALMEHRCCTLVAASNDKSPEDPDPEQDPAVKGFQRFLNILNKGVDIDRLAKIVNSDSDERGNPLALCSPSPLDGQSEGSHKSSSQGRDQYGVPWRDHGGARWGDNVRSPSGERRMELTGTQVEHHSRSLSPLANSATGSHFGSGSRSRSPAPVERRKDPALENQLSHVQLQGLLQTIGLTLGEEELGRLTDRTQERLFGKKEDKSKERLRERLLKPPRCSSSSSSSPDTSHQAHSSNKASRDIVERSHIFRDRHSDTYRDGDRNRDRDRYKDRDRDRDGDRNRDRDRYKDRDRDRDGDRNRDRDRYNDRDRERNGDRDRKRDGDRDIDRDRGQNRDRDKDKEREGLGDKDRNGDQRNNRSTWGDSQYPSTDGQYPGTQGQYPTNLPYPYPYPPPVNPPYTATPHYPHYTPSVNSPYPGVSLPSWGFPPGPPPPFPYPPLYPPPNPVQPLLYYNGLSASSTHTDTNDQPTADAEPEDFSQVANPDLSLSEGQQGDQPRPRCLLEPQLKTNNSKNNVLVVVKKNKPTKKKYSRSKNEARYQRKMLWLRRQMYLRQRAAQKGYAPPGSPAPSAPPGPQDSAQGVCGTAATLKNTQVPSRKPLPRPERKTPMTEEEMKAQLKKKLAEFNLKVKQNPIQPKESVSLADELD